MKKTTSLVIASFLALGPVLGDEDLWESKGPHVRIKKNVQDGSTVVFERSPDDRSLVKTTKDQNGRIKMKARYRRGPKGFLRNGQIYDGQGTLIYRVQYGYHPETGQLLAEQMFDARVMNFYPPAIQDAHGNRKEMPIRRVYYFYDSDGNQSKAISLVPNPGKTAQEAFHNTKEPLKLYGHEKDFVPKKATNPLLNNPFEDEQKKDQ